MSRLLALFGRLDGRAIAAVLLFVTAVALAGDTRQAEAPKPKSPAALAAIKRHDEAAMAARGEYLRKLIDLDKKEAADLAGPLAAATKAGNLAEANAIDAARKAALTALQEHEAEMKGGRVFHVQAALDWQDILPVHKGDHVAITATGTWCGDTGHRAKWTVGPDGTVKDAAEWGYLEGRIGEGEPFKIGARLELECPADGVLRMCMHDSARSDNDGALVVAVTVTPP